MSLDPVLLDARIRHLQMLQSAIDRMAENSARLKTLCISVSAALVAFSASAKEPNVLLFSVPLIFVFGGLDAQYLRLERAFRSRFDSVRSSDLIERVDFPISPSFSAGNHLASVLLSWSVWLFYLPIALILLGVSHLI